MWNRIETVTGFTWTSAEQLHDTTTTRIYWPSPQDYSEAVQTPRLSFADAELRTGQVETNALGLPRCMSGNFASVFCFQCPTRKVAVRCFLHNVPDQQARYAAISQFVLDDDLPYTVPFEYLQQGIQIGGSWYPLLKMEWIDGITLNEFVLQNLNNGLAMNLLASYFKQMTLELRRAGIAHGDLQHDNILISRDELRLVDYDGMFVPALAGCLANELGHPSYQHPQRGNSDFGPYLDNFSAWVIYASLKALSRDPSLYGYMQGGGDCLLLRKADFLAPDQSPAFWQLASHADPQISQYAKAILQFLETRVEEVPTLEAPVSQFSAKYLLPADPSWAPANSNTLPEWVQHYEPAQLMEEQEAWPAKPEPEQAADSQLSTSGRTEAFVVSRPQDPLYPAWAQAVQAGGSTGSVAVNQPQDPMYPQLNKIEVPLDANKFPPSGAMMLTAINNQLLPGETIRWASEQNTYEQYSSDRRLKLAGRIVPLLVIALVAIASHNPWMIVILLIMAYRVSTTPYQPCIRAAFLTADRFVLMVEDRGAGRATIFAQSIPLEEVHHVSTNTSNQSDKRFFVHARKRFHFANGATSQRMEFMTPSKVDISNMLTALPNSVAFITTST